jgi:putative ABC transport system substrate-binding protein
MRRREFIAGLGGVTVWPIAAHAQQALPVVGYLSTESADDDYKYVTAPFLQGLKENGYVEGLNVAVEYRHAENQVDRLPALAADLDRRRVAVIVATGTSAAVRAKAATTTIPIVFASGGDPVKSGLVASRSQPPFVEPPMPPPPLPRAHGLVFLARLCPARGLACGGRLLTIADSGF